MAPIIFWVREYADRARLKARLLHCEMIAGISVPQCTLSTYASILIGDWCGNDFSDTLHRKNGWEKDLYSARQVFHYKFETLDKERSYFPCRGGLSIDKGPFNECPQHPYEIPTTSNILDIAFHGCSGF